MEWNQEIFSVYVTEPGNYSSLRNGNWNFSGLRDETRIFFSGLRNKNLNFSETFRNSGTGFRKNSGFHFIRKCPGIPLYGTNFRIIPFPKWNFYSGIMETLIPDKQWSYKYSKNTKLLKNRIYL